MHHLHQPSSLPSDRLRHALALAVAERLPHTGGWAAAALALCGDGVHTPFSSHSLSPLSLLSFTLSSLSLLSFTITPIRHFSLECFIFH